jgi:hypothetical protein
MKWFKVLKWLVSNFEVIVRLVEEFKILIKAEEVKKEALRIVTGKFNI